MTMTGELREAIDRAGDEPVRLEHPGTKDQYVLVPSTLYDCFERWLEDAREADEIKGLLDHSRRRRLEWLKENPY